MQLLLGFIGAEGVFRGMTAGAMPQAIEEISAAVPLRRLLRIGLEIMAVEEEQIPCADEGTEIERKSQVVFRRRIADCRDAHQIDEDRVVVLAAREPEPGIGKGGVEVVPLLVLAVMHRTVKLIAGPRADAGGAIGSDIGCVDDAEWCVQSQSAGARFSALAQI